MELVNPLIVVIGIIVMIILIVIPFGRKSSFKDGKKIANMEMVEQTELYKKLKRRYQIVNCCAVSCLVIGIVAGLVLVARPTEVETINHKLRNRDIFMCLDVSNSTDEINVVLCERLKDVVKGLDGERFGITIFNGQSVLLVPLTTDYDFVLESLDKLTESIEMSLKWTENGYEGLTEEEDKKMNYKHNGTLADARSSVIGDGLAGCLYNFVDLKENKDRTRIIIMATDNDLYGDYYVSLEEASDLCKKNNVKVYGVAPEYVVEEAQFKSCVEKTGGKYYKYTSEAVLEQLITDIEKTDKSDLEMIETVMYDRPGWIFGVMMISLAAYFILSRVVKK